MRRKIVMQFFWTKICNDWRLEWQKYLNIRTMQLAATTCRRQRLGFKALNAMTIKVKYFKIDWYINDFLAESIIFVMCFS